MPSERPPIPSDSTESPGADANDQPAKHIAPQIPRGPAPSAVRPESNFDAVLETRLAELHRQIAGLKGRINTLFFFVLLTAILHFLFITAGVAL